MKRLAALLSAPLLALGMGVVAASPASAHTPSFSADCDGVRLTATAYDADQANRWSVSIDGVTQSGTFGASFDQTFPVPQGGATTAWSAFIEAADGTYRGEDAGSVGPCGAPPTDACSELAGDQPPGTACTPPPSVDRSEQQQLEGCDVSFAGTDYGAGVLTYDEVYTDTYEFDAATNTWQLVVDTTPTIADLQFAPWSVQQQVEQGCVAKADQPPAERSRDRSTEVDCDSEVRVTTVTTTITRFVYDADTNTWEPDEPVVKTRTITNPVRPGDCDDEVLDDQAGTTATPAVYSPASSSGSVDASDSSGVPTAVDAGAQPRVTASPTSGLGSEDSRLPLLVALAGVLALAGGVLHLRRT